MHLKFLKNLKGKKVTEKGEYYFAKGFKVLLSCAKKKMFQVSRHTAELIVSILGSFSRSIFQSQQINFYFWHDKSFSWDNRKKTPAKFDTYIHKFSDRKASER